MLSIVYITFRENCKFEWFLQSLIQQTDEDLRSRIQIIIVDFLYPTRNFNLEGYFEFIHVPPKPTVWQGEHRVTSENYFAAANTRNTGACYAKYPFIAFHDDLGCPSQTWLQGVLDAEMNKQVHCGAYTKAYDIVVENGIVVSKRDNGIDHRLSVYPNNVSVAYDSHFFGSSFCMPLELYFKLNGINEMCDGNAGEDYEFGKRIIRSGNKFWYNKLMFIYESEDIFGSDRERKCIRADPKKDPDDPKSDLSHYMLNYVNTCNIYSINSDFSLREYNHKIVTLKMKPDDVFLKPKDHVHFFTGKLISEGLMCDWELYINKYPDLKHLKTKQQALLHYSRFGKKEGRVF